MDHASVKKNLSAYLDGAVTPEEKALIEEHLEGCPECRGELRELAATVSRLRSLGEMAPPPWLAVKVMARIKEDAAAKRGLLGRLFAPFGWKFPVEVAALVFLTVTGYLVYRTVSPDVGPPLPQVRESREGAETHIPVTGRQRPAGDAVLEKRAPAKRRGTTDAGERASGSEPGAGASRPAPAVKPAPAPAAPMTESFDAPHERIGNEAKGIRKDEFGPEAEKTIRRDKAAPSSVSGMASRPSVPAGETRLQLLVEDRDEAVRAVRTAARRSGGAADWVESGAGEGTVVVRLERNRLREFLGRLSAIGDRVDRAELPNGEEEILNLVIELRGEPVP